VDLDNLLVTVYGKGRKERIIPISRECRATLYRYLNTHHFELVFPTKDGLHVIYRNAQRDLFKLLENARVEKTEGSFHAFRRFFAKGYVKGGGNLSYLMKQLGHTSIQMSKQYVEADTEELQAVHIRAGVLSRLR
jgi:integrase/recombinase XerD